MTEILLARAAAQDLDLRWETPGNVHRREWLAHRRTERLRERLAQARAATQGWGHDPS